MKVRFLKAFSIFFAFLVLFSSCASTTLIQSQPPGAKLYVNGEHVGKTPYSHTDSKIVGTTVTVRLEKEGYETMTTAFNRNEELDVGALVGGIFFIWPLFLWVMKYQPTHTYSLIPAEEIGNPQIEKKDDIQQVGSKYDQLRELKKLLDEGIITKDEYDAEKKKIMDK